MCRSQADAKDPDNCRCPSDQDPQRRRARQNAAYHAKKAATPGVSAGSSSGEPEASPEGSGSVWDSMSDEELVGYLQDESLRVDSILQGLHDDPNARMYAVDPQSGFPEVTAAGREALAAVDHLGAGIDELADRQVAAKMREEYGEEFEYDPMKDPSIKYDSDATDNEQYKQFLLTKMNALAKESGQLHKQLQDGSLTREEHREREWEIINEHNEIVKHYNDVSQGKAGFGSTEMKIRGQEYQKALSQIRPMGAPKVKRGEMPFSSIDQQHSKKATVNRLVKSLNHFPTEWINEENRSDVNDLSVVGSGKRAYYSHDVMITDRWGSIVFHGSRISVGSNESTSAHEYGHRVETETIPEVNQLSQAFLAARTTNEHRERDELVQIEGKGKKGAAIPQKIENIEGQTGGVRHAWSRPDSFVHNYMGRQYGHRDTTEIFTTGMESVFYGKYGGLRGYENGREDAGHRRFILGALASAKYRGPVDR